MTHINRISNAHIVGYIDKAGEYPKVLVSFDSVIRQYTRYSSNNGTYIIRKGERVYIR